LIGLGARAERTLPLRVYIRRNTATPIDALPLRLTRVGHSFRLSSLAAST